MENQVNYERMQLTVDRFQAVVWWCATAEKVILYIAADIRLLTSSNGGNNYDFSR